MTHQDAEALLGFPIPPGWTFHEVRRGGLLAGFIMVQGSEVHAWRSPTHTGRWLASGDLKRVLGPVLRQFGHVTTAVRGANATGQRFVERLGFHKTGEQNGNALYRAERLKHARL